MTGSVALVALLHCSGMHCVLHCVDADASMAIRRTFCTGTEAKWDMYTDESEPGGGSAPAAAAGIRGGWDAEVSAMLFWLRGKGAAPSLGVCVI